MTPSKRTVRDAIRILGEAARTDGALYFAADRLGLFPSPATALAGAAYWSDEAAFPVGTSPRQRAMCAAAENLLREGWTP